MVSRGHTFTCSRVHAFTHSSLLIITLPLRIASSHSSVSFSGQGLLSQSVLQLNNQEAFTAAGYHGNPGLDSSSSRGGQVGAVHIYNQVQTTEICHGSLPPPPLLVGCRITGVLKLFMVARIKDVMSCVFTSLFPPVGGGQPCCCPASRSRLSFPVPERTVCPAQPWQHIPHVF